MLPSLLVGFRTAISLSLILVIVSEMLIGGEYGLGRVISEMRYADEVPTVYAAIFLSGCLGFLLNLICGVGQKGKSQNIFL